MKKATDPMKDKEDIENSNDNKIDQDFKGLADGSTKENQINPETAEEKKTAAVNTTDGEKVNKEKYNDTDESESDGSGGAFEGTENMRDDD